MNYLKSTLSVLLISSSAVLLHAQTTFSDDFNEYDNDVSLKDLNGWSVWAQAGQTVRTSVDNRSPFTANTGNGVYIDTGMTSPSNMTRLVRDLSDFGTSALKISVDFQPVSFASWPALNFGQGNTPGADAGISIAATGNNGWAYHSGSGFVAIPAAPNQTNTVTANEWYRIEITTSSVDTATDTYSVSIYAYDGGNETLIAQAADLSMRNDIDSWTTFFTASNNNTLVNNEWAIDNFSIEAIPEAGTNAMLFGVGTLLVMGFKRIRSKRRS